MKVLLLRRLAAAAAASSSSRQKSMDCVGVEQSGLRMCTIEMMMVIIILLLIYALPYRAPTLFKWAGKLSKVSLLECS